MKEEIRNLMKDINRFIEKDIIEQQKYTDSNEEGDIMSEGFYSGRIDALEQVLELLENI